MMRMLRRCWAAVLCTVCLAACSPEPSESAWRIAVNPWVGYEPLVLAQEEGELQPLAMRVVELGSNSESKRAFRNGLIDVVALTLDETLRLADEGEALHIVAVLSDSFGADAVLARPGALAALNAPAPVRARRKLRIGLERTALGELMLAHWLAQARLTLSDVQPVHLEAAEHETAFTARDVDMLVTFEPIRSRLVQRGAINVFDTRALPGEVVDVLVARPGLDPGRLARLLRVWDRSRQRLASASAPPEWLSAGIDLTTTQYLQTLDGLRFLSLAEMQQRLRLPDTPATASTASPVSGAARPSLADSGAAMADTLLRLGLIRHRPDWAVLLDPVPVALAQAGPMAPKAAP